MAHECCPAATNEGLFIRELTYNGRYVREVSHIGTSQSHHSLDHLKTVPRDRSKQERLEDPALAHAGDHRGGVGEDETNGIWPRRDDVEGNSFDFGFMGRGHPRRHVGGVEACSRSNRAVHTTPYGYMESLMSFLIIYEGLAFVALVAALPPGCDIGAAICDGTVVAAT